MTDSTQLNYMIVDGVLGDFVQEIAAYIDKLDPPADEKSSFENYTTGLMESESEDDQARTFLAVAEKSAVLANAPEKEFESAYNLVLHILTFSPNLTEVLPVVLKNLTSSSKAEPLQVLSVLANLFNILPTNSPLRYNVFTSILSFADQTKNIHLLISQLKQLPQWLNDWGVDEANKKDVYYRVSEILASADSEESHKYLLKAVSTLKAGSDESTILSKKLVITYLVAEAVYDFDDIFALEAVQGLQTSEKDVFKLLEIVSNGDYASYKSFTKSSVDSITEEQWIVLEKKVKVLALGSVVYKASQNARTISYKDIAQAIDVSDDEIEEWVIDTIRAGLVEGRLSQNDQEFDIHRASPVGQFGVEQWSTILNRLDTWKASLKDVLDVVRSARENAQRENVGKFRHNNVTA
ncbi:hypothetical protein AWJ20_1417 [Sugiyamaella lignohabitans]|uniref:Eukaryotic translation initiation factor 3 subunit M n=1 Tax=Sugiyamaella lignohabitans TaxID=796027 RepID=A0A167DPF6_9ASCO|nr:uncharacterized protein AWJ20_1417 [Sugiyamaella lignohabitans]ANB13136.1 hypothetical protein AWJ20_1417 [Sugiyamaella lignohabitans]